MDVKDTAGAGDWTTAGLIYSLFANGRKALESLTTSNVSDALQYGQALAALNCQFEGARGAVYQLSKQRFSERVAALLRNRSAGGGFARSERPSPDRVIPTRVCPSCSEARADAPSAPLVKEGTKSLVAR